ncbi:universal stress protein [Pedobacter sp. P351]|uniref:universal stress protein n=1 Tax=Pedobacter superstes TaxID=3133441 RepID=UPI0030A773F2
MKTILVLTDFSDRSEHAAEVAWHMALRMEAELLFYNAYYYMPQAEDTYTGVIPVHSRSYAAFEKESLEQLFELTDRLADRFSGDKKPSVRCQNGMGDLAENVRDVLNKENIWMIIMGDKREEGLFTHLLYVSGASEVLKVATCPVLMIPEKFSFHNLDRVALALASFDQADFWALKYVTQMALPFDSEVIVIHVSAKKAHEKEGNRVLEEFYHQSGSIDYDKISFHDIQGDDITKSLVNFEQIAGLDMLAVVHKKHPFYEELFHTSTTKQLMGYHSIPLLVFPPAYIIEPGE